MSTGRRIVDFMAEVFDPEELAPIEVTSETIDRIPWASPAVQYRLRARDTILKVTVPETSPRSGRLRGFVLDRVGVRSVT